MSVKELTREQLIELKQKYYTERNENVSYGELADIDNLVSDEEIFEEYGHITFVEEDFFGTSSKEDQQDTSLLGRLYVII